MNELQVVVQTTPATLRWNFEELKLALAAEMDRYKGMIYTDEAIKTAKQDVADLRRLRKEVEDRRKEIKTACMEPYTVIEAQAKELTAIIDEPIKLIASQVEEYEARKVEERREEIRAFKESVYSVLPEKVAEALMKQSNAPAWEKLSASRKSWRDEIGGRCVEVQNDLDAIKALDADFQDEAMETYIQTFSIPAVLRRVEDLRRQREKVLAREREKQEAAGQAAAAAQEAAAVAEKAAVQPVQPVGRPAPVAQMDPEAVAQVLNVDHIEAGKFPKAGNVPGGDGARVIRLYCTDEQYRKITGYIRYVGGRFVEVR